MNTVLIIVKKRIIKCSLPFLSMMSETVASRKLVSYKRAIKDMKNDEESSYQGRAKS